MLRVYKYPVPITDELAIELPKGYKILKVELQACKPYLWALVDPDADTTLELFRIHGTGHDIDPSRTGEHVATFLMGAFVWHLFHAV